MALYMIRSHVSTANRDAVFKRYASTDASDAPAGVRELGVWSSVLNDGAYHLVETDDPKNIADWLMQWSDLCSYDIEPVISGEDFVGLVEKHGLS